MAECERCGMEGGHTRMCPNSCGKRLKTITTKYSMLLNESLVTYTNGDLDDVAREDYMHTIIVERNEDWYALSYYRNHHPNEPVRVIVKKRNDG